MQLINSKPLLSYLVRYILEMDGKTDLTLMLELQPAEVVLQMY